MKKNGKQLKGSVKKRIGKMNGKDYERRPMQK